MAITKKIRFEVFKRDGFKCAYCGKGPPEVILEIDHIQPKSKKGKNDINNLITACFDCNRGKKAIPLNKIPLTISNNLEVLKEKENQIKEYRKFIRKIELRESKDIEEINDLYKQLYPGWEFAENFKKASVKRFIRLLPKDEVLESLQIAYAKYPNNKDEIIKYFCGICWRKIKRESTEH